MSQLEPSRAASPISTPHPFRFAVNAANADNVTAWRAIARRAEGHGYAALLVPDHIGLVPDRSSGQLAAVPAMLAAADATTTLRVGSFVLSNDFRNPVVLAKEMATLDLLSEGRLEIGIGAGWMAADYEALGLPFAHASVRLARMIEAVQLIKRLLSEEGEVAHRGTHYNATVTMRPRPVQRPHPPIIIGGGRPQILEFAAREADIVSVLPYLDSRAVPQSWSLTQEGVERQIGRLRAAAPSRFSELELNVRVIAASVSSAAAVAERLPLRYRSALPPVLEPPHFLVGSRSEIVASLRAQRERLGISYFAIPESAMDEFAPIVADLAGT